MGKLFKAMGLVFLLEIGLILFQGSEGLSQTAVFNWLTKPYLWSQGEFLGPLLPTIAALGLSSVIIGSYFNKIDWVFRGSIVAIFITFGASLMHLFLFVKNSGLFDGTSTVVGIGSDVVMAALLTGPFFLFYMSAAIDFISGKD